MRFWHGSWSLKLQLGVSTVSLSFCTCICGSLSIFPPALASFTPWQSKLCKALQSAALYTHVNTSMWQQGQHSQQMKHTQHEHHEAQTTLASDEAHAAKGSCSLEFLSRKCICPLHNLLLRDKAKHTHLRGSAQQKRPAHNATPARLHHRRLLPSQLSPSQLAPGTPVAPLSA
jgi:hypothetical protein